LPYSPLAALQFQHNTWYPGGKFNVIERLVDLYADKKRFWLGELHSINQEMNEFIPISFNHFKL